MKILGINLSHNGSACILEDGEILEYLEEERFSRIKRDSGADLVIEYFLNTYNDIQYAVLVLSEAYTKHTFETHMLSIKKKNALCNKLKNRGIVIIDYTQMHHICHSANAYYASEFDECVCSS